MSSTTSKAAIVTGFFDSHSTNGSSPSTICLALFAVSITLLLKEKGYKIALCSSSSKEAIEFNLSFDNLCALLYNRVGSTFDKSQVPPQSAETMRLVVGYSEKGPFNTPVYIDNTADFKTIFGGISKKLEKKGIFIIEIGTSSRDIKLTGKIEI